MKSVFLGIGKLKTTEYFVFLSAYIFCWKMSVVILCLLQFIEQGIDKSAYTIGGFLSATVHVCTAAAVSYEPPWSDVDVLVK